MIRSANKTLARYLVSVMNPRSLFASLRTYFARPVYFVSFPASNLMNVSLWFRVAEGRRGSPRVAAHCCPASRYRCLVAAATSNFTRAPAPARFYLILWWHQISAQVEPNPFVYRFDTPRRVSQGGRAAVPEGRRPRRAKGSTPTLTKTLPMTASWPPQPCQLE